MLAIYVLLFEEVFCFLNCACCMYTPVMSGNTGFQSLGEKSDQGVARRE